MKGSFFGTKRADAIEREAKIPMASTQTQVWGATVIDAYSGKLLALFRRTQMILYPTRRAERCLLMPAR